MNAEDWLAIAEESLDAATSWLRDVGPRELDQIPDWGIWVGVGIGALVVFSIVSRVVSAFLRPIVKLVQIIALLTIAAAAGLYILQSLGYVTLGLG